LPTAAADAPPRRRPEALGAWPRDCAHLPPPPVFASALLRIEEMSGGEREEEVRV